MNDLELLRVYVREGSEPAFAELARRYVNIVYSAALRHVHDVHDAEDVTQAVFLLLSRKAGGLNAGVVVPAWLLRATHFASRSVLRAKSRRKRHETKAATMTTEGHAGENEKGKSDPDWQRVSPLLDEAIASLGDASRDALVLRFFRNKSYKDVAQRLAIAEPAARQRVSRAVEQLRAYFQRRGVVLSSVLLESLIISNAVHPAPHGLAILAAGTGAKGAAIAAPHAAIAQAAAFGMVPVVTKLAAVAAIMILIGGGTIAAFRAGGDRSTTSIPKTSASAAVVSDQTAPIRGRVLGPSGRPAAGVEVMLARTSSAVSVYGPTLPGVMSVITAADGTFEFPAETDAKSVVARGDDGVAQMKVSDLQQKRQIRLMPWGRIEGSLKVGANPVAHQLIRLSRSGGSLEEWYAWRVMHDARATTDAQGRFEFARVIPAPPGANQQLVLTWQPLDSPAPRSEQFHVSPQQTVRLQIGGTGRPVTGTLASPPGLPPFVGILYPEQPTLPAGESAVPPSRTIPVDVKPDGTFRADDVPAGRYWLVFTSSQKGKGMPLPDTLAQASAPLAILPMPGGRSDEPLNVGTIQARMNRVLSSGQDAPDFAVKRPGGGTLRLHDLRGKYVLLYIRLPDNDDERWVKMQTLKTVYDRFAGNPQFAMLDVTLDVPPAAGSTTRPAEARPWLVGTTPPPGVIGLANASSPIGLPEVYVESSTRLFLIGPDGKCVARSLNGRAALSLLGDLLPRPVATEPRIAVRIEHHQPAESGADAAFKTVERAPDEQNAARAARLAVVDGEIGENSGGTVVLNDGQLATGGDQPSASFFFDAETLEGRLRMDFAQPTRVRQISSYSWHKSHRAPQVYSLYGSDGTAGNFNAQPHIGTDPASCGWKKIADVDTRPTTGPDGGQYAVAVRGLDGPIGKYRHLLFVAFVTETDDDWGHTFFDEIEVTREGGD